MAVPRPKETRSAFLSRCMSCSSGRGLSPVQKAERCYGIWSDRSTQKSAEGEGNGEGGAAPAKKPLTPGQIRRLGQRLMEKLLADWQRGQAAAGRPQSRPLLAGGETMKGWVTIGGKPDEHGEHSGGTHVYINGSGKITKGPSDMVGHKPSDLGHKVTAAHGEKHPETGTREGPKEAPRQVPKEQPGEQAREQPKPAAPKPAAPKPAAPKEAPPASTPRTGVRDLSRQQLDQATFEQPKDKHGHLHQNYSGEVHVGGQKYFWKGVDRATADTNVAVADALHQLGVATPAVRLARVPSAPSEAKDGTGLLADWTDAPLYAKAAQGKDDHAKVAMLKPHEADRAALASYLLGIGDRTADNYLVHDGRLVSIDHDFSLWETEHDPARMSLHSVYGNQPFMDSVKASTKPGQEKTALAAYKIDSGVVREMAAKASSVAESLRKDGKERSAKVTQRLGKVLARMAQTGDTSYGNLARLTAAAFQKKR